MKVLPKSKSGDYRKPMYAVWRSMMNRCYNPRNESYARYGDRGIKVCKRWANLDLFVSDMGPRPSKDHSVERVNNNGNYSPLNCRWATFAEQNVNQRQRKDARLITFNGHRLTLSEWARKLGISRHVLFARFKYGWSVKRALTPGLLK